MVKWPKAAPVDYYIELDPTNFYLATNEGNTESVIFLESTQTGDTPQVYFDQGISNVFVQVAADVTFGAYNFEDISETETFGGELSVKWTS